MATSSSSSVDPKSGFCSKTKIFHSLRPHTLLPPEAQPLSISEYALSLLHQASSVSPDKTTALIDSSTDTRLSCSDFLRRIESLSFALCTKFKFKKGDTAFILSPTSLPVPILYFSLLSLGVIVSPANPVCTAPEISRQISLTKPVIAFATSDTANKLPSLKHGTVLIDSDEFRSMMTVSIPPGQRVEANVNQSDTAAILYSSGTTGRVKGVELTHRNFIVLVAGFDQIRAEPEKRSHSVELLTVPLFHVFGFTNCFVAVALRKTVVLMNRFDFLRMLKAVETYRVNHLPVAPPVVVAMAKLDVVDKFDLSSLVMLRCGGAPLNENVSDKFAARFPQVPILQGYGMTEAGLVARMLGPNETKKHGSVGRLTENMEAKIVDPVKGEALPSGQNGELWLRGPQIMRGYVGDDEATTSALDSEGWLKTGDLCVIDSDGFFCVVDRLKEVIKYKGYQVPPVELEQLLESHPEIAGAAVIPFPDEEAGQIPMACVVRKPGSNLSGAQVMDFIAGQVAPYKKLRRVAFISSIPRSPAGKILRRELINSGLFV